MKEGTVLEQSRKIDINQANFSTLFGGFEEIDNVEREEVILEVTYGYEKGWNDIKNYISLRIGKEKLYVIKDIKQFVLSLYTKEPIVFGQKFTFNPAVHVFNEIDNKIIDILKEMYDIDITLNEENGYYSSYNRPKIFKTKKVFLNTFNNYRLLEILKKKDFLFEINGEAFKGVKVAEDDLDFDFHIQEINNSISLTMDKEKIKYPVNRDESVFYYNDYLYILDEQKKKLIEPFIHTFVKRRYDEMIFKKENKSKVISEVLPLIKKIGKIEIDEKIKDKLVNFNLRTEVYFDVYEFDGIKANIKFFYGDFSFNPFLSDDENRVANNIKDEIVIRDSAKEREVLDIFEGANFKVNKGFVYIKKEEDIFNFVYNTLIQLKSITEIFYSDDFRNMKLDRKYNVSGQVRLKGDLLNISLEIDDFSKEEIMDILYSLREKKKYYRLKDGSFINLENKELQGISDILDNLDLNMKDIDDVTIEIPKFKAMYLDNIIKDYNLTSIKRNQEFKRLVENIREPKDMDFKVPKEVKGVLREYQVVGFKWLKTLAEYGFGGILADDMGLGKTLEVLTLLLTAKKSKISSIVVAPASLIYNWKEEAEKFAPSLKVLTISGNAEERVQLIPTIKDYDLVVTSYPLIRNDIDLYENIEFEYCFLDEAQHIKNPNTVNSKSVRRIQSKHYFALTGTPIENSLTELWSIFDFIMPSYLGSHNSFMEEYENEIIKEDNKERLEDLTRRIKPFVLRRLKQEVLKELPDKIETKVLNEMTEEQTKVYLAYLDKAKKEVKEQLEKEGFAKSQFKILSILTRLRQICCDPSLFLENYKGDSGKLTMLGELVTQLLEGEHRIVIFSQFTSMLDIIQQMLEEMKVGYYRLDGSTKVEDRLDLVNSFNKGEKSVFLISLKAGGTGLNLTGADTVIHYDPWWNPAVEEQATDRAYRIGQEKVVQAIKLITKGTIEEKIYELQQKKKDLIDSVIQPGETLINKVTEEELREILRMD